MSEEEYIDLAAEKDENEGYPTNIQMIIQLSKKIKKLEKRIQDLEKRVDKLEK